MFQNCWKKLKCMSSTGEALSWLERNEDWSHDIYDVDPYSSPWEAIELIGGKTSNRIGVVASDGSLRRQVLFRRHSQVMDKAGWDYKDRRVQGLIYWQYPSAITFLLEKFFVRKVEKIAVKYGKGIGHSCTSYFAAVISDAASSAADLGNPPGGIVASLS